MYPLGVYLARYFDWWSGRITSAPVRWVLALFIGPVVLSLVPAMVAIMPAFGIILALLGLALIVFVYPGLLVGYIRYGIQFRQEREELEQIKKVQVAIKQTKARSKGR